MGFLQDSRRHDGEAQVRSFDASGCGTILSEGSAFVVLETLDHAIKRGARILAEVVGFATASEAGFAYVDHRKPDGLEDCVGRLVANAQQERIVDIIGIGNGIASEDFGELCAYEAVGKASGQKMRVTSIRPSTGELSESSGVASLVIATEGMQAGRFSGVHRFNRTVEPLKQIEIPTKEYSTSNHAIITARGFNGVSCALHIQMFTG
jgi:3-oxoacyl-[acyl-carrier-protein] synthase II